MRTDYVLLARKPSSAVTQRSLAKFYIDWYQKYSGRLSCHVRRARILSIWRPTSTSERPVQSLGILRCHRSRIIFYLIENVGCNLQALALAVCDEKRRNIANVMQGFKKIRKQHNSNKNTVGLLLEYLWSLERFYCSDFGSTNMPRYGNYLHISQIVCNQLLLFLKKSKYIKMKNIGI